MATDVINSEIVGSEHVVSEFSKLSRLGAYPMVFDKGIGSIQMKCSIKSWSGETDVPGITESFVRFESRVGITDGLVELAVHRESSVHYDDKSYLEPKGIRLESLNELQGLEAKLKENSPRATVNSSFEKDDYDSTSFQIQVINGKQVANMVFYYSTEPNGETYAMPVITAVLTEDVPLDEQLISFSDTVDSLFYALGQFGVQTEIDDDFTKRIEQKIENEVNEKIKELPKGILDEQRVLEQSVRKLLFGNNSDENYEKWLLQKNAERIKLIDDPNAEPDFTPTNFPFVELAKYDLACQPYLSPARSRDYTMALYRLFRDQGKNLDERVVRIHYMNFQEYGTSENPSYEILTGNPKRVSNLSPHTFEITVGSTHSNIEDTLRSRIPNSKGRPIPSRRFSTVADLRGVCLETQSGKKYMIIGIAQPSTLRGGAVSTSRLDKNLEEQAQLDPTLLADFQTRYGIQLLSGKYSFDLMDHIIFNEFMDNAARENLKRVTGRTGNTVTNHIRSRQFARSGIQLERKDLSPEE